MSETGIEEYLKEHGTLTYRNVGTSMMPLLKQGRDVFTLSKKTSERCKKNDVALYKRSDHVYVLHRIVDVREDDYVFLGDNCVSREYGIRDEDIIGVVTTFVHKGKQVSVDDPGYRLYVWIWSHTTGLRTLLKRIVGKLR